MSQKQFLVKTTQGYLAEAYPGIKFQKVSSLHLCEGGVYRHLLVEAPTVEILFDSFSAVTLEHCVIVSEEPIEIEQDPWTKGVRHSVSDCHFILSPRSCLDDKQIAQRLRWKMPFQEFKGGEVGTTSDVGPLPSGQ
jgi:hypothetical protein